MRHASERCCGAPKRVPGSRLPFDPRGRVRSSKKPLSFEAVHAFLRFLFAEDLQAKRVLSLAGATLGVIQTASLTVAMIGRGLALARGRLPKHTTQQVDRLPSNPGIEVEALLAHSTPRGGAANAASATARTSASV